MSGDLLGTIVTGILCALVMLAFTVAVIMGVRGFFRMLRRAKPSKGVPGWVWLLGAFVAAGSASQERQSGIGGGVGAVAADFLALTTLIIAVTLVVRAIFYAIRPSVQRVFNAKSIDSTAEGRQTQKMDD